MVEGFHRSASRILATVLFSLIAMGVQGAAAATLLVDDDGAECPTAPYTSIQAAIDAANPNDTIQVCAGTYAESAPGPLTINKPLTLLGAQAGVDARTRGVVAESFVEDIQGTSVSASDVVIDGFTVRFSSIAAFTGFGLWLNPGIDGTTIVNNIIEDNIVGIGLANSGPSQAVIQHNLIRNNIAPGGASGTGIYTDEFSGGLTVTNVLIEENAFIGHSGFGGAINISNTAAAGGVFDLQVISNRFDTNSRAFVLFNTHNSTIRDNTSTNSTFVASADIRIFDNNTNLSVLNNNLSNGVGHAIRLSFLGAVGGPSSDVVINENNIGTVGSASFALTGLTVDPLSHVGTVNAECNWWGSPSGPVNPNNPMGTGEEVVGDADFQPWLNAPAPGGACVVPSTPGRVTGGGQIGSEPVFSPLGDLLSLPALIPSLVGPTAQATFGFVAKCCAPSGNLQYNDHEADVRIKAQSVDGLLISSPATSCPLTPGSKHATFSGMASVIRPTGTTMERYTVDVDDCGEPGSADTLGIETETYANGPSQLIGGNIQIHK